MSSVLSPALALAGHAAPTEARAAGGTPCVATALLLAVPLHPLQPSAKSYAVQLLRPSAHGGSLHLYRAVTTVDGPLAVPSLAVSGDGRWLSYSDGEFRLHVVSLPQGHDRIIGRGMMPQFSYDARFVAFVTGSILPISSPGPQAEQLLIYDLHSAALTRVGPAHGPLVGRFAWAPRDDRLAWQLSSNTGPLTVGVAAADHPSAVRTLVLPTKAARTGGIAWGAGGQSLLYWRFVSSSPAGPRYALTRWRLPAGPTAMLVAPSPTSWFEGEPPAVVMDKQGRRLASLLGGPHGQRDQVALYTGVGQRAQLISLPGEPRLATFAPRSTQFVVVWETLRSGTDVRQATLVTGPAGQVQNLGSAVAAFWIPQTCAGPVTVKPSPPDARGTISGIARSFAYAVAVRSADVLPSRYAIAGACTCGGTPVQ